MFDMRRSEDRGLADHGWLRSRHTFSFAGYQDPRFMGYRSLRVINDDRVEPGAGFSRHPHRDMEIVSYVVEGALEHRDSMGNGSILRPGDVQRMTAGTGVTHSEFNPSDVEGVRFLQIWIQPGRSGLEPGYEQRHFLPGERRGNLRLVASPDGRDASIVIHQDAFLYAALLAADERVRRGVEAGRGAWVQVVRGSVRLGETELDEGDGGSIEGPAVLELTGVEDAELIVFDLA